MSTSRLQREDANFLYLSVYLHNDADEYSEWMMDDGPLSPEKGYAGTRWPEHIILADAGATYEVRIDYKINKLTGQVTYEGYST